MRLKSSKWEKVEKMSDDDEDFPFRVEYAMSDGPPCKTCSKDISPGSLRLAIMVQDRMVAVLHLLHGVYIYIYI